MQSRTPPLFNDLARIAGGAANALGGMRGEIEGLLRGPLERLLSDMELVTRDEFDAVKAVAAKARAEQERLEKRVAELEAKLGIEPAKPADKKAAPRKKATPRKKPAAPADTAMDVDAG